MKIENIKAEIEKAGSQLSEFVAKSEHKEIASVFPPVKMRVWDKQAAHEVLVTHIAKYGDDHYLIESAWLKCGALPKPCKWQVKVNALGLKEGVVLVGCAKYHTMIKFYDGCSLSMCAYKNLRDDIEPVYLPAGMSRTAGDDPCDPKLMGDKE